MVDVDNDVVWLCLGVCCVNCLYVCFELLLDVVCVLVLVWLVLCVGVVIVLFVLFFLWCLCC